MVEVAEEDVDVLLVEEVEKNPRTE